MYALLQSTYKDDAQLNLINKQLKKGIKKMDARFIDIVASKEYDLTKTIVEGGI